MKDLSHFLTSVLSIIATVALQCWFNRGLTTVEAVATGLLFGLGAGYLIGRYFSRYSLERKKEENQEKQRQWERDRAELTPEQIEMRLRSAINASSKLSLDHGRPILKADKTRICTKCLIHDRKAELLERHKDSTTRYDYFLCPYCGNREN